MHRLTHLDADVHQRLAHAGQERPTERLLALGRRIDSSSCRRKSHSELY